MDFFLLNTRQYLLALLLTGGVFVCVVLMEAAILFFFRINNFGRALLHSFFLNAVSFLIGYIVLKSDKAIAITNAGYSMMLKMGILFVGIIVTEGIILSALNKETPLKLLWLSTVMMNVIGFLILLLWLK